MEQLTADKLQLILVFVVPGFVASQVYRLLSPGPKPEPSALGARVPIFAIFSNGPELPSSTRRQTGGPLSALIRLLFSSSRQPAR
jgi:hypothetical protein